MTEISGDQPEMPSSFEAVDAANDYGETVPNEERLAERVADFVIDPANQERLGPNRNITKYDSGSRPALQFRHEHDSQGRESAFIRFHYSVSPTLRGERSFLVDIDKSIVADVSTGEIQPVKDSDKVLLDALEDELFGDPGQIDITDSDSKISEASTERILPKDMSHLTMLAQRHG